MRLKANHRSCLNLATAKKIPASIAVQWMRGSLKLFPLNCADGLGSQVQQYAVDAFHFVGDAVGDVM